MIDFSYHWHSLPEPVKEWVTKIAVTIAIALAWHWWCRRLAAPPTNHHRDPGRHAAAAAGGGGGGGGTTIRQNHRGVDRAILDPLPQDLLLKERIDDGSSADNQLQKEQDFNKAEDGTTVADDEVDDNQPLNPRTNEVEITSAHAQSENLPSSGRTLRILGSSATPLVSGNRPVFRNTSRQHPGLEHFWRWCDVECSLFRVYGLGTKNGDGNDAIPPFIPRSRRGNIKVSLQVVNRTDWNILVYWINYKGDEELKGRIQPNAKWNQQTWIEHPWVFRNEDTGKVLVHYVPERIIPHCTLQPTVDENDATVGVHRFVIDMVREDDSDHVVEIQDPVLPFPARNHIQSIEHAVDFALLHMHRMKYLGWDTLVKYLTNILYDPGNGKFRQIRIANPTFYETVWQTPARGLLLAIGFVEQGACVELGTAKPLTNDQKKMLSTVLFSIAIWKTKELPEQPAGADGFGRAGFGRAGMMS